MVNLPRNYDTWRLQGPDEPHQIGTEEGDECNRVEAPDEDAPRGYRPRPCTGVMVQACGEVVCETCGGVA
jgi:hypothetical protein